MLAYEYINKWQLINKLKYIIILNFALGLRDRLDTKLN